MTGRNHSHHHNKKDTADSSTKPNSTNNKKKKTQKKRHSSSNQNFGLELMDVQPKTFHQREVFECFNNNHLLLSGVAGTGKTFLALYLGLREILERKEYKSITIIRSAVQTRDMGFMPGSLLEKVRLYETPYADIVNKICHRDDAYGILRGHNAINFMSTSFLRGLTIENSIIIVDEFQNCTFHEIDSIMTRIGEGSKLIVCGDIHQSDIKHNDADIKRFNLIFSKMENCSIIDFDAKDIVRSGFVREWLEVKYGSTDDT